jgi:hypothetical protein
LIGDVALSEATIKMKAPKTSRESEGVNATRLTTKTFSNATRASRARPGEEIAALAFVQLQDGVNVDAEADEDQAAERRRRAGGREKQLAPPRSGIAGGHDRPTCKERSN